jgi:hypothetical protein
VSRKESNIGLFILRIDYKCNPVAYDALPALFTQYRFEMFKYEKL